jgi:hypothetical protein
MKSPRLGVLIWSVLIIDSLPGLIRLGTCVGDVIDGHAGHLLMNYPSRFVYSWCLVLAIGIYGLIANLLILLRNRAGVPLAVFNVLLVVLCEIGALWEHRHDADRAGYMFMVGFDTARLCWLALYGFVIWSAAKKLAASSTSNTTEKDTAITP